jgi:hypothetical protein
MTKLKNCYDLEFRCTDSHHIILRMRFVQKCQYKMFEFALVYVN